MYTDLDKKFSVGIVTAMEDDLKQKLMKVEELKRDTKVQQNIVIHKDKMISDMNKFE